MQLLFLDKCEKISWDSNTGPQDLRALSTLRGLRGVPEAPPLCRETQSLGQQMLNAPVGINGLNILINHSIEMCASPHIFSNSLSFLVFEI